MKLWHKNRKKYIKTEQYPEQRVSSFTSNKTNDELPLDYI